MLNPEKGIKKEAEADSTRTLNSENVQNTAQHVRQAEDARHRSRSTTSPQETLPLHVSFGRTNDEPENHNPRGSRRNSRRRNRSHSRSRNANTQSQSSNNFADLINAVLDRGCVAGHVKADIVFHNHPDFGADF